MTHDPTTSPGVPEPSTSLGDGLGPDDGLGSGEETPDLDALMLRLRSVSDQVDAAPPLVADLARAAFETRDLDAELAVLTADSDVDTLALTRAPETSTVPRMVSLESGDIGIELQFESTRDGVAIRGLITGAAGVVVELDTGTARSPVALDADGWFESTGLAVSRVRLRITDPNDNVVTTPWISL